jgi:hypothetical protein
MGWDITGLLSRTEARLMRRPFCLTSGTNGRWMIRLLQPRALHQHRRQHLPHPPLAPPQHPVMRLCGKPVNNSGLLEVLGLLAGCFSRDSRPHDRYRFGVIPRSIEYSSQFCVVRRSCYARLIR